MATIETSDAFPLSRHLPLGRPYGAVDGDAEPPSELRPFGMRLARRCPEPTPLNVTRFGYDTSSQTGTVRTEDGTAPLARHTDGQTNTVTDGGDGQGSNKDSDSDVRED